MGMNTYYLELMFIYWVSFSRRIYEKGHIDRDLIFEEKRQEALEKNLVINLLGLIKLKKTTMQTMKLAEYKHL